MSEKRHINPDGSEGGWVSNTGYAESTVSISPAARILDNAQVFDNARIYGNAQVCKNVELSGNAWWSRGRLTAPVIIQGSRDTLEYQRGVGIQIGCQWHTLETWMEQYREIGRVHEYLDEQIAEYFRYLTLCAALENS